MYNHLSIVMLAVPMRFFFCGSFLLFVFRVFMLSCPFIAALWSPAGKEAGPLALLCVMFSCV